MALIEAPRRLLLLRLLKAQALFLIVCCLCDIINTIVYHADYKYNGNEPRFGFGVGTILTLINLIFMTGPILLIISGNLYVRYEWCWFVSLGFCQLIGIVSLIFDQATIVYQIWFFGHMLSRSSAMAIFAAAAATCILIHAILAIVVIILLYKEKYRQRRAESTLRNAGVTTTTTAVTVYQVPIEMSTYSVTTQPSQIVRIY